MTRVRAQRAGWGALPAVLALGLFAASCKESPAGSGESCTRSLQCEAGLACVEGVCSADLGPLEDPDRIPMLTPPVEEMDGAVAIDAAAMMTDAATPAAGAGAGGEGGAGAGGAGGAGAGGAGGAGAGGAGGAGAGGAGGAGAGGESGAGAGGDGGAGAGGDAGV